MKKITLLLLVLTSVAGCAAKKTPFELAQEGPTMKETYAKHVSGGEGGQVGSGALGMGVDRKVENDINYEGIREYAHKRVANPEMKMFIYPHRSTRHGAIVPGYYVNFPMYEKVQYSLVGDVAYAR